ncbi:MAG: hypothetical protein IT262_10620 [Saprospiraceae bacterium]|nr:hypothetical protein [Saprospiraceae bacterium]
MKPRTPKKPRRPPAVPSPYRDLKSLRRQTNLYAPFDFRDYLQTRHQRLKPETVKGIAKYHRMKRPVADPETVALWLAETIFEKTAWP